MRQRWCIGRRLLVQLRANNQRLLFNKENTYNKKNLDFLNNASVNFWLFQLLIGLAVSTVMAYFAKETGLYLLIMQN